MPTFNPPIEFLNPAILPTTKGVERALFKYYGPYAVGVSVIGPFPTYRAVPMPRQELLVGEDGVDYFLGGHVYEVTTEVAEALIGSGFEVG